MRNLNKIYKWLSTFGKEDKKQLLLLIRKLNKIRSLRTKKLVEYLWECSDKNSEPKIEVISLMFYKKTTFDKTQMRNYLNKTWDFIEDFLVHKHMQNELRRKQALQELAEERRIYDEFEEINTELITRNELHIGSEGHFNKYIWQAKKYFWDGSKFGKVKKSRAEFKELANTLEQTYAISKLQLLCEQQSRVTVTNDKEYLLFTESLLNTIKQFQEENPLIKLYYFVYLLLSKQLTINLSGLKKLFYDNYHLLTTNEQLQLIIHITNHLIANYNQYNDKKSIEILFDLYKLRLKLNSENSNIEPIFSPYIFINMTQLAVIQFKFEFVEEFIATYADKLPLETKYLVPKLCKAIVLHKKENFKDAYLALQNLKTTDKTISLRLHAYRILCLVDYNFFFDNDKEIVRETCYLFKKWLERNKSFFGENSYLMYTNLIRFVLQLISNDINLDELRSIIQNTEYVGSKNWLLRKVNQLKNKGHYAI